MRVFYSLDLEAIDVYHQLLELASEMGFKLCLYGYDCDECLDRETCT